MDDDITSIERRILSGTDEHSSLNKLNETQVSGKAGIPCWILIDILSTVNLVMNKELVKDICDVRRQFIHVHWNSGTRIIRTEVILP